METEKIDLIEAKKALLIFDEALYNLHCNGTDFVIRDRLSNELDLGDSSLYDWFDDVLNRVQSEITTRIDELIID